MNAPSADVWLERMQASEALNVGRWSSGYHAVTSTDNREPPSGLLRTEEQELPGTSRRLLLSSTRGIQRNFSIAAWMIRRHLDDVATWNFRGANGDYGLDSIVEGRMEEWSEPAHCDLAGRHGLQDLVRLMESHAVVDGDVFLMKLRRGYIQAIEGDRIRPGPTDALMNDWGHGVRLDDFNRAIEYSVCRRTYGAAFVKERTVPARHMIPHGYYTRFDQVRGVSPLASGLNSLIDVYENVSYALAKAKASQLMGLHFAVDEDMPGETTFQEPRYDGGGLVATDPPDATSAGPTPPLEVVTDLSKGPLRFKTRANAKISVIESQTPSTQFQSFTQAVIQMVLAALDIPYSFYSEDFTTYSGARQALLQYQKSAGPKRLKVRRVLNMLTRWKLAQWEYRGKLPKSARADLIQFRWLHAGMPWVDPLSETEATVRAVSGALESRTYALQLQGRSFDEVAEQLAYENRKLQALGLPTSVTPDNALLEASQDE